MLARLVEHGLTERHARALLRLPSSEQTVYLNLSGTDRAEIYHEEKTSVLGEIIGAVEQSISELIAYLRPAAA